jgi:hypothetical protein
MMFNRKLSMATVVCIIWFSAQFSLTAQVPIPTSSNLGAEQLQDVRIDTQGISPFFAELSLTYNIPIGLETAANEYEHTRYSIDFKKGTLAELLTQFVNQHSLYTWKIEDGVANVFPKDGYRDALSRDLLATNIERFSVKENTSCWNLAEALATQPETKRILEANKTTYSGRAPSGFYIPNVGKRFTLEVSEVTLKSILNKVVSKSSTAKFWVIGRNPDKTLLIDFIAQPEDSLRTNGRQLRELSGDKLPS